MKNGLKFGLAGLLICLAGCAATTYEVKGLNSENSAYLKADSEHEHGIFVGLDERLYIHEINGVAAGDFIKGYPEDAKILQGENEVKVEYWHSQISSNGCVKFFAEAGNTYIIRKKREGMSVYYWVVKEGSEKPISKGCSA
ncbi:hypothetical protein [Pseudoalteromonas byunsanensis]|uniref:Lipoprotein n=1 Tax=Pseudoalteromonas byunsanensis TaxID=327939 RepID=A0A1S1N8E9_9GAMM|nr:hypothetical protein [Pseudoalteromonas byunsanensis]OHU94958.1 hypothetical protein BIW53_13150 [Pseudoalteromonas byunsanensis]